MEEVKNISIATIQPYSKNAKKHPRKQIKQIADSIARFGFNQPIVVDKNDVIIVGHGRYEAAKLLGMKDVPVMKVNLNESRAKAYRLADNKLNESDWDMEIVIEELKAMEPDDIDFTGFLRDLMATPEEADDSVPAAPETPKSKRGDLYTLGNHRVLCGDSTNAEDVAKLMNGVKADMVFTDPPYGVSYASKNEFLNANDKGNRIKTEIKNDHMSAKDTGAFVLEAFSRIAESIHDKASFYVSSPQGSELMMLMLMMDKAGIPSRHTLIWAKNQPVLGRADYNYQHEPILFGWKKTHIFYGKGAHKTTLWQIPKPRVNDLHPTMKPIELIVNALLNSSKAGDTCLDMFLGSGSTLIACEKTNRRCFGMELDEHYCDVIVQRYVDFTGNKNITLNGEEIVWGA